MSQRVKHSVLDKFHFMHAAFIEQYAIYFPIIAGTSALIFALCLYLSISRQKVIGKKAKEISSAIQEGARAFLFREYRVLVVFILAIAVLLYLLISVKMASAFLVGAFLSALAGNIGMRIATLANVRAAESLKKSFYQGLSVAFSSGMVMGLGVVGFGVLGVTVLYIIFKDPQILYGMGFGASLVALFARVGGGIYTKAADVGADLVGKIERGIPEDDPRNPAVIADNVGDNVGDVAGMGADLFESFIDAIIACMVIGFLFFANDFLSPEPFVILPLLLVSIGIFAAILGNLFSKFLKKTKDASRILNLSVWMATLLTAFFVFLLIKAIPQYTYSLFYAFLAGLLSGIFIGMVTEYYTSSKNSPTRKIALSAETGAATNIIAGLSTGMLSTFFPVIIISLTIYISYRVADLYGVAIAAVGMLSTLGITLATDSYGPVADNSAGIAEMAGMGKKIRHQAENLDAVGNTTAAIGKGFAIGSAALTALVLMVSYGLIAKINVIDLLSPKVIIGLFVGAVLPFVFSSFAMAAVGRAAVKMVEEVRRQFREIKGLANGTAKPDYRRCIDISTGAALKEMIVPSLMAVAAPVLVGFILGKEALGGFLAGSIVTGFLLAVFMANAGGAWDNAKKYIEEGNLGGKGSDAHKASVVGDTVGDPLKDTSGPSLNILIKLMSIVSLIIAPLL